MIQGGQQPIMVAEAVPVEAVAVPPNAPNTGQPMGGQQQYQQPVYTQPVYANSQQQPVQQQPPQLHGSTIVQGQQPTRTIIYQQAPPQQPIDPRLACMGAKPGGTYVQEKVSDEKESFTGYCF